MFCLSRPYPFKFLERLSSASFTRPILECFVSTKICTFHSDAKLHHNENHPPEMFCKKGVLGNFAKFTKKHVCQSLFFINVVGLKPGILLKKRLWHTCFPVNFLKFLRTPLFIEHIRWLLLLFQIIPVFSHYRRSLAGLFCN